MAWKCICGNVSNVRHDECPVCSTWGGYWPVRAVEGESVAIDDDDSFHPNEIDDVAPQEWQPTKEPEWDSALGKGYSLGATILLNGGPGAGKSRAILRHADTIGGCVVSSEMSR